MFSTMSKSILYQGMFRSTITETAVKTLFPVGLLQVYRRGLPRMWLLLVEGTRQRQDRSTVHRVLWRCQAAGWPSRHPGVSATCEASRKFNMGRWAPRMPQNQKCAFQLSASFSSTYLRLWKYWETAARIQIVNNHGLKILWQWQWVLHSYLPELYDK